LNNIKAILSSLDICESDDAKASLSNSRRAFELFQAMVMDHNRRLHILDKDTYNKLKDIASERLRWYRSKEMYDLLIMWAEVLFSLVKENKEVDTKGTENCVNILLLLSEAHYAIREFSKAHKFALEAYELVVSPKTMLALFKASLFHNGCQSAVEKLIESMTIFRLHFGESIGCSYTENFEVYISACRIAIDSDGFTTSEKMSVFRCLLWKWLELYLESKQWRFNIEFDDGIEISSQRQVSYSCFTIAAELCRLFLFYNTSPSNHDKVLQLSTNDQILPKEISYESNVFDRNSVSPHNILTHSKKLKEKGSVECDEKRCKMDVVFDIFDSEELARQGSTAPTRGLKNVLSDNDIGIILSSSLPEQSATQPQHSQGDVTVF
jgi:hypothetical protein